MYPHPKRRRAASLCLAMLASLGGVTAAQDAAPTPDAEEVDPEMERLRREAEAELLKEDDVGDLSDEDEVRRSAELATEDESPLYNELLTAFGAVANRLNAFNPRITVFGDALARISAGSGELTEEEDGETIRIDDRMSLREVELDLRADIDPYAKGVLIIAAEDEGGEYEFTIEEGYMTLETLPFGFRVQAGRMRVPFGRINRLHTHDLPKSTRPLALEDQFGHEGYVDNGAIATWLAPFAAIELYAGVLQGDNEVLFGEGQSDLDSPTYLGRAEYFLQATDTVYGSIGASYLYGHNDTPNPADQESHLFGADLLLKWQPSQFSSIMVQGELYALKKELEAGTDHAFGGYAMLQVQPWQRWYFGVRYDYSDYDEQVEDGEQWAASAYASFYTSEFLRFRIGYEHRERQSTGGGEPDLDTIFFQLTFVFGSHPVEPFWFNR
jgi:hypothetical protein